MDYLTLFDKILEDWGYTPTYPIVTNRRVRLIDEEDYEIVPRKHFIDKQIKSTEQALQELKDQQKIHVEWYEERIKDVTQKLDQLKKRLPTP